MRVSSYGALVLEIALDPLSGPGLILLVRSGTYFYFYNLKTKLLMYTGHGGDSKLCKISSHV